MESENELPQYLVAHIRRAFAEDPRTCELGVRVTIRASRIYLSGEVNNLQRKTDLETIVREMVPSATICNDIHIVEMQEPHAGREELR